MTDNVHPMEATVLVTPKVLREVNIEMRVFCDVTPYSLVKGYQMLWETSFFNFESRKVLFTLKMAERDTSDMLAPCYQTTWHHTLE